ncbi:Histidine kinase-, DNA gyrase B-, and HSP90-like ATPase [Roseovarius gaetbuli]|uniref:Histidine kinase-, DNA gyrase B-, and HSP90-like ATPase n=1 Tax=Roseovarius gaetbuli TaxID=1356575 RepID=A0A1X6ZRD2_9RHOB|nr:ATP-binding protein [Roseovarius gaetbuli]SLN59056.1 Histidine kinase-, DNA gyrase B-, and HSP90-like ATPase [Roseovarius gaetbuli]
MHKSRKRQADATPYAAALIEGMRDFGYTLETAMADIIDNSVTAGASRVEVLAETTSDDPWIAIVDDGVGMTEVELVDAMRPGSKNPLDEREGHDLGRFGLGLKSASFSQCRLLTVISCKEGAISGATWDLDKVAETNVWSVELEDDLSEMPAADRLPETGTIVLWRKLDRLSTNYRHDSVKRSGEINKALSGAERHLRLCFHRYMEGSRPKLRLLLNGRLLSPIDPFATEQKATQVDPEERLALAHGEVVTQSFTLPHHKMISKSAWDELGGSEGHLRSQGFYIYREKRLIIAGSWLGLARQTELTKLSRVRVDIPNTMDADWKIDVRKASAQMPPVVRDRLRKIVERLQGASKRTYQRRGRKLVAQENLPLWSRVQKDGSIIYRPNTEHPSISGFSETLPEEFRHGFRACIKLLGSGLPIAALHADMLGAAESIASDETEFADLAEAAETAIRALRGTGMSGSDVVQILCSTEPFVNHKDEIRRFVEDMEQGETS